MHTIRPLCSTNSQWQLAHQIRQTVTDMTEMEKQRTLDRIHSEQFFGCTPDPQIRDYVVALLEGKQPRNGISRKEAHA